MGLVRTVKADFAAGSGLSDLGRRDYLGLKDHFAVMAETVLGQRGQTVTQLSELPLDAVQSELSKDNGKLYPWTDHNNKQLRIAQRDLMAT